MTCCVVPGTGGGRSRVVAEHGFVSLTPSSLWEGAAHITWWHQNPFLRLVPKVPEQRQFVPGVFKNAGPQDGF